jgi:hypothetical protein
MPGRVNVPMAPRGRAPIRVGGGRRSGRGPGLIGAALALVIVALLIVIALPVGALILIGFGGYIGVLAHRAGALTLADPPVLPMSVQESQPLPLQRRPRLSQGSSSVSTRRMDSARHVSLSAS